MMRLAFLFLIYGRIDHEDIWYDFFSKDTKNRHSIYIHYKYDKPLKYFEQYKLEKCIETLWGHISIVKAQNILLQEAIKDESNTHFIFCSGTCVPFKTFDYVYNFLLEKNQNYSYFNMYDDSLCFPRCNNAINFINKKFIKKASQWCILSKKHVKILLNPFAINQYIKWFNDTVGDEHCYVTYLHYNGFENELIKTYNASEKATTFVNWSNISYVFPPNSKISTLQNYEFVSPIEISFLMKSPCLFGRKFLKKCDLSFLRISLNNFKKPYSLINNETTLSERMECTRH
jgi:hypothetical protein